MTDTYRADRDLRVVDEHFAVRMLKR